MLIIVPDVGSPRCVTYPDMQQLMRGVKRAIREANEQLALPDYTFYVVHGNRAQLYVDDATLDVMIELAGKKYRPRVIKQTDMMLFADGKAPQGGRDVATSGQEDAWGDDGFNFS